MLKHPHHRLLKHPPHHSGLQTPAAEALHEGLFTAGTHHKQHALLRFREQILVSRHALFTGGHLVEVQFDPQIALRRHLRATAGEARCAHVLSSNHISALEGLEASFDQPLLQEWITNLNSRAIV